MFQIWLASPLKFGTTFCGNLAQAQISYKPNIEIDWKKHIVTNWKYM